MAERILFLTGRLAEKQLHRVLESMHPVDFAYRVEQIGISVAALMTPQLIMRRVSDPSGADKIMVPGRCRGDLEAVSRHFGIPVMRGPDDLKDLPEFFGHGGKPVDLSQHDVRIFAEIVDAPLLDVGGILDRARAYREDGADVVDLGCLPDTDFPHLEDAVKALRGEGFAVSVDSATIEELRRGGLAGADYLLSLTENTLDLADEVASCPVLIPAEPGDLDSLMRAVAAMRAKGKPFLADPILDPIHFGFTESLARYLELRRRDPDVEILMGIGNLTELTGADTVGITATLMGIVSELAIRNVLVVRVSPHARRAVREVDAARRIMYRAKQEHSLPIGYAETMLCLHDRRPFAYAPSEIEELAAQVRDPSFRVQVSERGVHVFNRDLNRCADDPFALFPHLGVEDDGAHAFYLGVELARAQTAWQLGKSYSQDEELDWGCAADKVRPEKAAGEPTAPGHTLAAKKKKAEERRARKKAQTAGGKKARGTARRGTKKRKPPGRAKS
ncbi:MAG: DUF6513 domain-containing protein [Alphaproteobacteria bacterium]